VFSIMDVVFFFIRELLWLWLGLCLSGTAPAQNPDILYAESGKLGDTEFCCERGRGEGVRRAATQATSFLPAQLNNNGQRPATTAAAALSPAPQVTSSRCTGRAVPTCSP